MFSKPSPPPLPKEFYYSALKYENTGKNKEAFKCYKVAAFLGMPEAMWNMSRCYQQGIGVRKYILDELIWLERAANAGHIVSMVQFADLFEKGELVGRNEEIAQKWYNAAVMELWNRTVTC